MRAGIHFVGPQTHHHLQAVPLSDPISTFVSRNKKNTPENTAFLNPVIASRKRRRPFKSEAPSRTILKERKGPNKREWRDHEITQLINLWEQEEALYNSKL